MVHGLPVCECLPWSRISSQKLKASSVVIQLRGSSSLQQRISKGTLLASWKRKSSEQTLPKRWRRFSNPEPHQRSQVIWQPKYLTTHFWTPPTGSTTSTKNNKVKFKSQWEVQEHLFTNSNKIRTGSALSQRKPKSQIIMKQEVSVSRKLTAGCGNKSKGLIPSPYF